MKRRSVFTFHYSFSNGWKVDVKEEEKNELVRVSVSYVLF